MSDFLTQLARRSLATRPTVVPRPQSPVQSVAPSDQDSRASTVADPDALTADELQPSVLANEGRSPSKAPATHSQDSFVAQPPTTGESGPPSSASEQLHQPPTPVEPATPPPETNRPTQVPPNVVVQASSLPAPPSPPMVTGPSPRPSPVAPNAAPAGAQPPPTREDPLDPGARDSRVPTAPLTPERSAPRARRRVAKSRPALPATVRDLTELPPGLRRSVARAISTEVPQAAPAAWPLSGDLFETASSPEDSATEPDVHISIGRVEVRAAPPPAPPPRAPAVRSPRLSLEDYLKRPVGGAR